MLAASIRESMELKGENQSSQLEGNSLDGGGDVNDEMASFVNRGVDNNESRDEG